MLHSCHVYLKIRSFRKYPSWFVEISSLPSSSLIIRCLYFWYCFIVIISLTYQIFRSVFHDLFTSCSTFFIIFSQFTSPLTPRLIIIINVFIKTASKAGSNCPLTIVDVNIFLIKSWKKKKKGQRVCASVGGVDDTEIWLYIKWCPKNTFPFL